MKTILFQGDSITDWGRDRNNDEVLGDGYPKLVKAAIGADFPGQYQFLNRGISGNRVVDLYARIRSDIINLKPDVMSVLIGVNDVWHGLDWNNGVAADKFFRVYSMLIGDILEELPDTRIMILEPFVLEGSATEKKYDRFRPEVEKRAEMAKAVAQQYGLPFVPLQASFDAGVQQAPAEYWLSDGVHPTLMGHELIKRAWINAFRELIIG